jgi:hypothetical protein
MLIPLTSSGAESTGYANLASIDDREWEGGANEGTMSTKPGHHRRTSRKEQKEGKKKTTVGVRKEEES